MPNDIRTLIVDNKIEAIKKCDSKSLRQFVDDEYENILLLAVRRSSVDMLEAIAFKLDKKVFDDFLKSDDAFDRSALMLAALADSASMLQYLHKKHKFKLDYRNDDEKSALTYAIERNKQAAFGYLLINQASFTDIEKIAISKNDDFKQYFNSPACFLIIIQSKNKEALNFIMRHIKNSSATERKTFYAWKDEEKKKVSSHLLEALEDLNLNAKEQKNFISSLMFNPKSKQAGSIMVDAEIQHQPYRSFLAERERQLLRQAATQLFFYLEQRSSEAQLIELQMMHLAFDGKHMLFIAVNAPEFSQDLKEYIMLDQTTWQAVLTKKYHTQNTSSTEENKIRSKRYADKLAKRVFDKKIVLPEANDGNDWENANEIAKLLKKGTIKELKLGLLKDKETIKECFEESAIYFVSCWNIKSASKRRHAEEYLCDIADHATAIGKEDNKTVYACIGGKKRPCMGCSGRMEVSIDNYGKNPGLFWTHTLENQSPQAAKATINLLLSKSPNDSFDKANKTSKTDFDSGSDSEIEPINKPKRRN